MSVQKNEIVVHKMTEKAPVLITNGWVRTSYNIVESLGRKGIPVHVVDSSKYAMCRFSKWTKSFHLVPDFYREPKSYVQNIAIIIKRLGIKVVIPVLEDIINLAEYEYLLPRDIKFIHPELSSLKLANDKWEVISLCKSLGIPAAESYAPSSFDDVNIIAEKVEYPVVIKTRKSNSGKGVFIVRDRNSLVEQFFDVVCRFSLRPEKYPIIQEYLGNEIIGVCMLYYKGMFIAATAEAYLRCKETNRFGTSVYRISIQVPEVIDQCRVVADYLSWNGVIQFDLIADKKTGRYKIIEINPRFWGGLNLSIASGVDFPYLLYELAVSGKTSFINKVNKVGTAAHWVLGELLGILNLIKSNNSFTYKLSYLAEILSTSYKGTLDDLRFSDPLPFIMEAFDYLRKYIKTGSTNPIEEQMMR